MNKSISFFLFYLTYLRHLNSCLVSTKIVSIKNIFIDKMFSIVHPKNFVHLIFCTQTFLHIYLTLDLFLGCYIQKMVFILDF